MIIFMMIMAMIMMIIIIASIMIIEKKSKREEVPVFAVSTITDLIAASLPPLPLSLFEVPLCTIIYLNFLYHFLYLNQSDQMIKETKAPFNYIAQTLLFPKDNFINSFAVLKIVKRNKIPKVCVHLKETCHLKTS